MITTDNTIPTTWKIPTISFPSSVICVVPVTLSEPDISSGVNAKQLTAIDMIAIVIKIMLSIFTTILFIFLPPFIPKKY